VEESTTPPTDWQDSLPELYTERLRLRPYRIGDSAAVHRIMSAPETFQFSERGPMTSDESWARLLRHAGHWALLGYGLFAVVERDSGEIVGEVGHADFRRGLGPAFDGAPEASWTFAPHVWGRRYAAEATSAAHRWLMECRGVQRTVCIVHRDNQRSLNVAARLGYGVFDTIEFRGYPALLLDRVGEASSL
jgi:RimJ/RimL family protein N-acetyltransferase